ncbi:MAG: hypothetical protein QF893_09700 [Alphaproteobacteria bacterium]|jgi:hypothetical protein|nr:hypothetical protein [Alphaproteobacteria bacterium]
MRRIRDRLAASGARATVLAAAFWLGSLVVVEAAPAHRCQAVFDRTLAEVEITEQQIRDYTVVENWAWYRTGRQLLGYSAWVALAGCKGSIVIDVSEQCWFEQAYVHGPCRVEGLKSY